MAILIQEDGIISPFSIIASRETILSLMPETRDSYEEVEAADGDVDFGTDLGMVDFLLHGIIELEDDDDKYAVVDVLKDQLNDCRIQQELTYECQPTIYALVRLTGKPEITENPHHIEVRAQFKADPFWRSVTEYSLTGAGNIVNNGTFECPILIEIPGPMTSPSISVGASVLAYTGYISAGALLVIDTDTQTAKIGSINAMATLTGDADYKLAPGVSVAVVPSISSISVSWNDRWI